MRESRLVGTASLQIYAEPFPYFTATAAVGQVPTADLLTWLESQAQWNLVEADFYEQHELNWPEDTQAGVVAFLTEPSFLDAIRQEAVGIFNCSFDTRVDCSIHKLLAGQRIRIHNDLLAAGETHRVILHINRGWSISKGGFLMLFNSEDSADVHRVLMPLNGSIVGFEISEKSHHAVSTVIEGERFAIVYSLYAKNAN